MAQFRKVDTSSCPDLSNFVCTTTTPAPRHEREVQAWCQASAAEWVGESPQHQLWTLSEGAGDCVGLVALEPDTSTLASEQIPDEAEEWNSFYVLVLAVATDHRGRGHASRLLTTALDIARTIGDHNVNPTFVHWKVHRDNSPMHHISRDVVYGRELELSIPERDFTGYYWARF